MAFFSQLIKDFSWLSRGFSRFRKDFSQLKKDNSKKEDLIDFDTMYDGVDKLGVRGYKMTHLEACKKIWHDYVPKSGQSNCVQGELLRQLEALRGEAQDNGNINWDDDFEFFCDFIRNTLLESGIFESDVRSKLDGCLNIIKSRGKYAYSYNHGQISDDTVNPMLFAYVYDDLYDYIADAIAIYDKSKGGPVPYAGEPSIIR